MSLVQSQILSSGLFFLFIFLSGFWASPGKKTYPILTVTIHKLIGLAAGVFLGLTVYRVYELAPLTPVQMVAIVVTVLSFAVNVATGSLLSTNKPMPAAISIINRFFPYLTVVVILIMLSMLA